MFFLLGIVLTSCGVEPIEAETAVSVEISPATVFTAILDHGLTCGVQESILGFNEGQHEELAQLFLLSDMSIEARASIVETREVGCFTSEHGYGAADGVGAGVEAITGTYSVVFIPEGTTSGNYANSVFRDSSSSSWMCNSGSPENPADFVVQFHLQGAYYSQNSLELQGTNWWGSCYLGSTTASRVYSDDDIRSCIGYWTTILCGGTPPQTTDMIIGL